MDSAIKKSQRNTGIELLRIVSMIAIMVLHVLGQGGILNSVSYGNANYNTAWLLEILCYFSVTTYGLISGYVGIDGKYRLSNIIYLWLQVFFYMLLFTIGFGIFLPGAVGKTEILGIIFPVITEQYWYFSAYFGVFLLVPFIKAAFEKLEKKHLGVLLWIGLFITVAGPLIFTADPFGLRGGLSLGWLLMAYYLGAYIKRYGCFEKVSSLLLLLCFALSVLLTWGLKLAASEIPNATLSSIFSERIIAYNSITLLPASISILIIFKRMKIQGKAEKVIGLVAPLSFGVYLLNCQPMIWKYIMLDRFADLASLPFWGMAVRVLLCALIIFFIGIAVDGVRKILFDILRIKQKLDLAIKFGRID